MKRQFLHLLGVSVLVVTAGCYNYRPPQLPTEEDTYSNRKHDARIVLPPEITLLTLEKAQEIALTNNPDFESRYFAVRAAWSRYNQSIGAYFPTISVSNNFSQNFDRPTDISNLGSINSTDKVANSMGLTASWTVFNGLQRTMNLLQAKHEALGEEAVRDDSRRTLLLSVAEAYNSILLAIENNRIAKTDKEFQLAQLKDTNYKYEAGASPLSDVLNFQVKVNDATNNEISSEYDYNASRYALAELMGIPESTLADEMKYSPVDAISDEPLLDINIYLDNALSNRPDLRSYRELLQAAKYQMYSKWGAFSPTVSVYAGAGYSTNATRTDYRNGNTGASRSYYNNRNYNWGVNAEWVLFNGGKRFFALREAQAMLAKAEYNVASSWIQVVREVRAAYDSYIQNVKKAKLFQETQGLVTKQRDLVEEEYKAGNKELTRLNEAQRDLVEAETNLVIALVNVMNAKAQLEAATNSNRMGADITKGEE